jgi:hypothetical protein
MRVLHISLFPPTRQNLGGPSALTYYLAKHKAKNIDKIDLVYLSGSEIAMPHYNEFALEVFSNVKKLKRQYAPMLLFKCLDFLGIPHKFIGSAYRFLPIINIEKRLNLKEYDLIWIYPCVLFPWLQAISHRHKVVLTTPDCSLLHYELALRVYSNNSSEHALLQNDRQYKKLPRLHKEAIIREMKIAKSNAILHVVGRDDLFRYGQLNPALKKIFYSPHPVSGFKRKTNTLVSPKLSVLMSGNNHSIYSGSMYDDICDLIAANSYLKDYICISFLGSNFDRNAELLFNAGYEVSSQKWVDNYENELLRHDLHVFGLRVGTGTKGKVLSSMATGLVCLGNHHAFENIEVDHNELLEYNKVEEIPKMIKHVCQNREEYRTRTQKLQHNLLERHKEENAAEHFWDNVLKHLE